MTTPSHVPVLLDRVVALLTPALGHEGAVLVDATLGLGGHSEAVLARCELARVVGIDRDPEALRLAGRAARAVRRPVHRASTRRTTRSRTCSPISASPHADGVLFDLGVSSMQLDVADRGFAYREDAPLDMRMDPTTGPTAADVLNTYPRAELTRVLREYGEERFAPRIAAAVVRERDTRAVHDVGPAGRAALRRRSPRPHGVPEGIRPSAPSRRCGWRSTTSSACCAARSRPRSTSLAVGGRVVVESYHSLEDRLVKRAFAAVTAARRPARPAVRPGRTGSPRCAWSPAAPSVPTPTRSPHNPRAASVRLRAVERIRPAEPEEQRLR